MDEFEKWENVPKEIEIEGGILSNFMKIMDNAGKLNERIISSYDTIKQNSDDLLSKSFYVKLTIIQKILLKEYIIHYK